MRTLYRAILWLYPAEYKAAFATEMWGTFEQARADSKNRGILHFALFTLRELLGLLRGLFAQRIANVTAHDAYVTARSASSHEVGASTDIGDIQRHIDFLIRSMEYAIAHHDFPKARYYSVEERMARARLQTLLG